MNLLFKYIIVLSLFISYTSYSQTTDNYGLTGAPVGWVVPPCVTSVDIVLAGAQGGSAPGTSGGSGTVITTTIVVTPGDAITINVGGAGGCPTAGYNGGGLGFNATNGNAAHGSCGGGGGTEISINGTLTAVAGGGGGAGGGSVAGNTGGDAGCGNGNAGISSYGAAGGGGTAVSGGTAGAPWAGTPPGGNAGSAGQGGNGGFWQTASGGGGGGGYFGGGGGGNDGCCTGANGGGAGGGGSSLNPGGPCVAGSNNGDGYVSITYNAPIIAVGGTSSISLPVICAGDPLTLTLAGYTGVSFQWESAPNAAGPWTPMAGAISTPYLINAVNASTCYRALVTSGCPPDSYSTISCVTVDQMPTPSNAGPDQSVCGTNGNLAANIPAIGTGLWTVQAGSGSVTNTSTNNSGVTTLSQGSNIFTWTISNGVCPSSADDIEIWSETPVNAGLDNLQSLCNTAGTTLDLNTLLSGADAGGAWSETSAIPSGTFTPLTGIL